MKIWTTLYDARSASPPSSSALDARRISSELAFGRHGLDVVRLEVRRFRIHAAFEVEELNLAEVDRRGFGLYRNVAAGQRRSVDLDLRVRRTCLPASNLGLRVFQHRLSFNDVLDAFVAMREDFDAHPLIAVVGL